MTAGHAPLDTKFSLDRSDLTDRAYLLLRQLILERQFQPNERLSIDRLAERLGVSRTPVKDALHRLEGDGLVTISPRVGSFVTPLTSKDAAEVFDLRLLFELHSAEIGFPHASADSIAKLAQLAENMEACIEGDHYRDAHIETFLAADRDFHTTIVATARNDRLLTMYEALGVHVHLARACYVQELANVSRTRNEHTAIVKSYREGDLPLLKMTLRKHITTVRDLVLSVIDDAGGLI